MRAGRPGDGHVPEWPHIRRIHVVNVGYEAAAALWHDHGYAPQFVKAHTRGSFHAYSKFECACAVWMKHAYAVWLSLGHGNEARRANGNVARVCEPRAMWNRVSKLLHIRPVGLE